MKRRRLAPRVAATPDRRFATTFAAVFAVVFGASRAAFAHETARITRVPLDVAVCETSGGPAVADAVIADAVAAANEVFAPHAISFVVVRTRSIPARHARLETRADRDALAPLVGAGAVQVFFVESLRDVDDPAEMRRGVHWHAREAPAPTGADHAHYVIVSSLAGRYVLAHELGHFLGNPRHSAIPGNLMSYERGDGTPVLDDAQLRKVRRALRRYLDTGELTAVRATGVGGAAPITRRRRPGRSGRTSP